jgi:16S rRNA A1518/A1519 N6-dimethyltransferase RsmA/KsgA/DIM1 with predicted DNA glycosylase/AP lyase activity
MLQLADVRRGETIYDLGAGDGRVIIQAVREFGAKAVGIEIDPDRVSRIKDRLNSTGVKAEIVQGNFMEANLSLANVIIMYLSDSANAKLGPKLKRELGRETRVVSLDYAIPGWTPAKVLEVSSGALQRKIFLYKIL